MDRRTGVARKQTNPAGRGGGTTPDNLRGGNLQSADDQPSASGQPNFNPASRRIPPPTFSSNRASGSKSVPQAPRIPSGNYTDRPTYNRNPLYRTPTHGQNPANTPRAARVGNTPSGTPIFQRKQPRTEPIRSLETSFDRLTFFETTPPSAKQRAEPSHKLYHISQWRPNGLEGAATLKNQEPLVLRESGNRDDAIADDNAAQFLKSRVARKTAGIRRDTTTEPTEPVIIKEEPTVILVPKGGGRMVAGNTSAFQSNEIIEIESDEEQEEEPPDVSARYDLLIAVKNISYSALKLQKIKKLPFLRRNLRRGFLGRCLQNQIPTHGVKEKNLQVSVLYRFHSGDERQAEYRASMGAWMCPICKLHGEFYTRDMLQKHLRWDHLEVDVVWNQEQDGSWSMAVTVPSDPLDAEVDYNLSSDTETPPDSPQSIHGRRSSPIVIDDDEEDTKPIFDNLKYSFGASNQGYTSYSTLRPQQFQLRSRDAESTDPIGPKAQKDYHLYLGYAETLPSCRPEGLRLYDLLAGLSLKPFGVLAWSVLDKEEELFEMTDTRDEDKVMQVLWGRWIMLNRRETFIPDYFLGVQAFIDEYAKLIHLAAGWAALRVWLIVLTKGRFLNGSQVAKLLLYYETLVIERDLDGEVERYLERTSA